MRSLSCGDLRGYSDVESVAQLLEEAKRRTDLAKESKYTRSNKKKSSPSKANSDKSPASPRVVEQDASRRTPQASQVDEGHDNRQRGAFEEESVVVKNVKGSRSHQRADTDGAGRVSQPQAEKTKNQHKEKTKYQDKKESESVVGDMKAGKHEAPVRSWGKYADEDDHVHMNEDLRRNIRMYEKTLHIDTMTMLRSVIRVCVCVCVHTCVCKYIF